MSYLFGLLLSSLLMVSLARADNAPYTLNWNNFGSPDVGVFLGPSLGVDQVNGETFGAALPLAGGIEEYTFTMFVNSNSSGIPMDLSVVGGCFGLWHRYSPSLNSRGASDRVRRVIVQVL